jgi:hypothetical protein
MEQPEYTAEAENGGELLTGTKAIFQVPEADIVAPKK